MLQDQNSIEVFLPKKVSVLINIEDLARVNQYIWSLEVIKGNKNLVYFKHCVRCPSTTFRLHRNIMNAKSEDIVDHINGNTRDNRKANLRFVTYQQNTHNRRKIAKTCSSKFKGVSQRDSGSWRAYITHNKKRYNIGEYNTEIEAAMAYDNKARKLFKEFACLNFPDQAI